MKNYLYAIFFCFVVALISGCMPQTNNNVEKVVNAPAKDFSLLNIDNKIVTLADFKDKIVILNFWATWCPPCQKEIPDFVSFYEKYQDKGVVIVGVAIDEEGVKVVKPFTEEYKMNYPVLIGNDKVVADYGGMVAVPTSFLIDKSGKICKRYLGFRSINEYQKDIDSLLKKPQQICS